MFVHYPQRIVAARLFAEIFLSSFFREALEAIDNACNGYLGFVAVLFEELPLLHLRSMVGLLR